VGQRQWKKGRRWNDLEGILSRAVKKGVVAKRLFRVRRGTW